MNFKHHLPYVKFTGKVKELIPLGWTYHKDHTNTIFYTLSIDRKNPKHGDWLWFFKKYNYIKMDPICSYFYLLVESIKNGMTNFNSDNDEIIYSINKKTHKIEYYDDEKHKPFPHYFVKDYDCEKDPLKLAEECRKIRSQNQTFFINQYTFNILKYYIDNGLFEVVYPNGYQEAIKENEKYFE
jgi:hypothetical protein